MRGLDETDNPYREQYGEWDYWAYANGREMTSSDWESLHAGKAGNKKRWFSVGVDKDGFAVPLLSQQREQCDLMKDMSKRSERSCVVGYSAFGEMPDDLAKRMQSALAGIKAEFMPEVPRWLANNPPTWAMILPSGEVVISGDLGSGKELDITAPDLEVPNVDNLVSYRYSSTGKLISQTEPGEQWYTLFWDDSKKELSQYNSNETATWPEAGFVIVRKLADWSILAVYDYDGTKLAVDTDVTSRDWNVWQGLYGQEIALVYNAQQHFKGHKKNK